MPPFDFILLHHALHVVELLEQTVSHPPHATAEAATAATRTFDDVPGSALFQGHPVDDRRAPALLSSICAFTLSGIAYAGNAHQANTPPIFFHLAQYSEGKSVRSETVTSFLAARRPASRLYARSTLLSISSISSDSTSPYAEGYGKRRSPGWNSSSASGFSPTPGNLINLAVIWRIDSAAPPPGVADPLVSTAGQRQPSLRPSRYSPHLTSHHRRQLGFPAGLMAAWLVVHHRFVQRADDRRYPPATS